jgi:hypothetical protein
MTGSCYPSYRYSRCEWFESARLSARVHWTNRPAEHKKSVAYAGVRRLARQRRIDYLILLGTPCTTAGVLDSEFGGDLVDTIGLASVLSFAVNKPPAAVPVSWTQSPSSRRRHSPSSARRRAGLSAWRPAGRSRGARATPRRGRTSMRLAKPLLHKKPKVGRFSLRAISAELAFAATQQTRQPGYQRLCWLTHPGIPE